MKNRRMLSLLALLVLLSALFAFSRIVSAATVSQPASTRSSQATPAAAGGGCAAWLAQSMSGARVSWKACLSYQGTNSRLVPDEIISFHSNNPSLFASCQATVHLVDSTTQSIVQTASFDCARDARKSLQLKGYQFLYQNLDCSHRYYTEANVAFVYGGSYGGGTWSSNQEQGFTGGIGGRCL